MTADLSLLHRYLKAQRSHITAQLEGLDDEALARPVLPSGWSCLMLVHHLTLNELLWFGCVVAGDAASLERLGASADWQLPAGADAASVMAAYDAQTAATDRVIEERIESGDADRAFAWWPEFFGDWRLGGLADLMLHEIAEMATHAGQLDAVRELIDGRQFLTLE